MSLLTAEHPCFEHGDIKSQQALTSELDALGLAYEVTHGRYRARETVTVIYGATRSQARELSFRCGQECVVFAEDGRHELIYTSDDEREDRQRYGTRAFVCDEAPEDRYTFLPGCGYVHLLFEPALPTDRDRLAS